MDVCTGMYTSSTLGASVTLSTLMSEFLSGGWIFSVAGRGDRHFVLNWGASHVIWKCLLAEISGI